MNDTPTPKTVADQYISKPKLPNGARMAHYGRFSTPRQASLEDQERCCRAFAAASGGEFLDDHIYTDAGRTGTILANRPGLAKLRKAVKGSPRPFDYVVITDTARLSRNIGDIFTLVDEFNNHGVQLYFIDQQLDSADTNFRIMLIIHSVSDENQVTRIKQKSREAVYGRVQQGYAGSRWGYGYRGVRVDRDTPYAAGYEASRGTKLEIVESEAPIVRRVMHEFAEGQSVWRICLRLNEDGVPWPRGGMWTPDGVKHILHYELYVGVNHWNATSQKRDRETGRVTKEKRPAHEHYRVPLPHLRIVSDELWGQVQARLQHLRDKQNARRLGGYNRAKNADYPYSGSLYCGLCNSRMRITGKQGRGVYDCPNHRARRGCKNSLRIPEKAAAAQITAALANELLVPETTNWLAASVFLEINKLLDEQDHSSPLSRIRELEQERRAVGKKMDNLRGQIENFGGSEYLAGSLAALENRRRSIDKQLAIGRSVSTLKLTENDVRELVEQNVANLQDVLKSNLPLARQVLHHHLKKLSLYPGEINGKPVFEVVGELDLITPPEDKNDGALLGVLGTQNLQQSTIDRALCFTMTLVPELEPCALLEPLCKLLEQKPNLQLDAKTPTEWAQLLNELIPDGPDRPMRLGYGLFSRCMWRHRDLLAKRLIVTKTPNPLNIGHLYQLQLKPKAETRNISVDEGDVDCAA